MAKIISRAPVSAAIADKAVKAMALAVDKAEGAQVSLLVSVASAVATIGQQMTAAEWDKQITPGLKEALGKAPKVSEGSIAGYLSRMKVCGLAILTGDAKLQPQGGETLYTMWARVSGPLASVKLKGGVGVYGAAGTSGAKKGRKKGTAASNRKPVTVAPSAPRDLSGSAGSVADQEGGNNVSPELRAAAILLGGEGEEATRLALVAKSYRDALNAFTRDHLAKVAADALKSADKRKPASTPPRVTPPSNKANGAAPPLN